MNTNDFFDSTEIEEIDLSNYAFFFADVETTGLSEKKERMTEIAIIKTDSDFNDAEEFEMLINPEREISEKITELTGITEEMIENEPIYEDAMPTIKSFITENLGDKTPILIAHNAPFDLKFINKGFEDVFGELAFNDFIDTVSLARELYPFWRNHKLDTCANKFGIPNENHHRALNDTRVLFSIGKKLIPEAIESGINPVNFKTRKKLHY